jgi:hypothetical protein
MNDKQTNQLGQAEKVATFASTSANIERERMCLHTSFYSFQI